MSSEQKNLRTLHTRQDRKRRGLGKPVPMKYLDNPPHRIRSFLGYMFLAVVVFLILYLVLHPK